MENDNEINIIFLGIIFIFVFIAIGIIVYLYFRTSKQVQTLLNKKETKTGIEYNTQVKNDYKDMTKKFEQNT